MVKISTSENIFKRKIILTKIWLFNAIMSSPNQPSVKYNAAIYPTEECITARRNYMEVYEAKPPEYKLTLKTEAFCIPFDSFPIAGCPSR
jgi:hypothetical protein